MQRWWPQTNTVSFLPAVRGTDTVSDASDRDTAYSKTEATNHPCSNTKAKAHEGSGSRSATIAFTITDCQSETDSKAEASLQAG